MKSKIKILGVLLALIISMVLFTKQASAQQSNVSFQVFYDQLSPYGQWVDYPNYGYVWIPDAGSDFSPYSSRGHWIMTNYGWTWASDYNWGWAPFHYGRWDYDNSFGWFWVPDNEWGPAWVTWRRADGYYGWSPMQPGISISASFGRDYDNHYDRWTFVRDRDMDRSNINRYYANRSTNDRIIRNSTVINNTYSDNQRNATYVSGPKREDVQRYTGRTINPVTVQENSKPGQNVSNGRLNIYRPQVTRTNNMGQRPAPSRITDMKDVNRPAARKATNQPQTVNRQQPVKQQQNVNRQQPVNQQQNVNRQQPVNQQQNVNRQQPVNQQQNVNKQQPVNQQQNVNKQQPVNQPQNANRQQTVNQPQTNTAKPQESINNSKVLKQQNANASQNNRRVKQSETVKPSAKDNKAQQKKSKSEQDKRTR